jgi:hypothetical protein
VLAFLIASFNGDLIGIIVASIMIAAYNVLNPPVKQPARKKKYYYDDDYDD